MIKKISNKGSVFQIEVSGKIKTSVIDFMDDFEFRRKNEKGENTFVGWPPDQTALLGLIAGLTDLRCEIKCVRDTLK